MGKWLGCVVLAASLGRLVWTPSWVFVAGVAIGAALWSYAVALELQKASDEAARATRHHEQALRELSEKFDGIKAQLSRVESLHALKR